jgi:hypothetical protein
LRRVKRVFTPRFGTRISEGVTQMFVSSLAIFGAAAAFAAANAVANAFGCRGSGCYKT